MEDQLQAFDNEEFGKLEIMAINSKPYFPATECAKILGYSNPRKAILDHCRCVTKRDTPHPQNPEKIMERSFIPEGDLYRLITRSKLPSAERFERWVFDEVLPSIRKHGAYISTEQMEKIMNDPDAWIMMLTAIKDERAANERLQLQIEEERPKVVFADAVSSSDNTILIGELAKILRGNGVEIGQNRLFEKLRQDGYLIKRQGGDYNMPTQKAMELDLFKVKESVTTHPNGHVLISKTTKVTGKGQQYFANMFLKDGERSSEVRGTKQASLSASEASAS
jgi:anti-repressor protein